MLEKSKKRIFERSESKLKDATCQKLIKINNDKKILHIVYIMTQTKTCGGTKIILEHANKLTALEQKVTLVSYDQKPNWFDLDDRVTFIQVPINEVLGKKIPECDIIVTSNWREIHECIEQQIAPVIYFEQGSTYLFDENFVMEEGKEKHMQNQVRIVPFILTVSSFAAQAIKKKYNKNADIIPNAVDNKIFYPNLNPKEYNKSTTVITTIGPRNSSFKKVNNIVNAIAILKNEGYNIEFNLITPDANDEIVENTYINPEQILIGDILRKTDIYICASMFESFGLPVLEAMTCGAAVITTDTGGMRDFAFDKINSLIIEKDNIEDIVAKTKLLIADIDLQKKLINSATETSKKYSWNHSINMLLDYYKKIAQFKPEKNKIIY